MMRFFLQQILRSQLSHVLVMQVAARGVAVTCSSRLWRVPTPSRWRPLCTGLFMWARALVMLVPGLIELAAAGPVVEPATRLLVGCVLLCDTMTVRGGPSQAHPTGLLCLHWCISLTRTSEHNDAPPPVLLELRRSPAFLRVVCMALVACVPGLVGPSSASRGGRGRRSRSGPAQPQAAAPAAAAAQHEGALQLVRQLGRHVGMPEALVEVWCSCAWGGGLSGQVSAGWMAATWELGNICRDPANLGLPTERAALDADLQAEWEARQQRQHAALLSVLVPLPLLLVHTAAAVLQRGEREHGAWSIAMHGVGAAAEVAELLEVQQEAGVLCGEAAAGLCLPSLLPLVVALLERAVVERGSLHAHGSLAVVRLMHILGRSATW